MNFDDWIESFYEDERDKIYLYEVWEAAVNATIDALVEEGNLSVSENYRKSWTQTADNVKGD